jgi:hypothetical protein
VTTQLQRKQQRKLKEEQVRQQYLEKCKTPEASTIIDPSDCLAIFADEKEWYVTDSSSDSHDDVFCVQKRIQYPNLSQIMKRTGISNRDACKIINAALPDMNLDKPEYLLEPSKVRRQRIHWSNKAVEKLTKTLTYLLSIGFDGRIDETRLLDEEGHHKTNKEDYCVVVAYTRELYVDHAAPQSGKASDIAAVIL